ncbi:MAG: hypothetical protein GX607_21400 [Myxococcales bacterium]|jgi:hypothetical protein|nr:hypothetical protein [Myxococcales bacterium]
MKSSLSSLLALGGLLLPSLSWGADPDTPSPRLDPSANSSAEGDSDGHPAAPNEADESATDDASDDAGWGLPPARAPEAASSPDRTSPETHQDDAEARSPRVHGTLEEPAEVSVDSPPIAGPLPGDEEDPFTSRRGQLGIAVGVPFYDDSIIHGDMTVDVRYGRKFWWLVPSISGGFRQARLDPAQVPDHARRKKLEAWHATVGLRLEIPTSPRIFPFVGIAGELSTWSFTADTTDFCQDAFYPDAWRCYRRQDWKMGWAVKPQLGFVYKPEPSLALEFWVERGTVFAPDTFTRRVSFIAPALGFTWHH